MRVKFELGLFESPYVDPARAALAARDTAHQHEATTTQAHALVVLENSRGVQMLPDAGATIFLHGVDSAVAHARGYLVVNDASQADVAILRLKAPFQVLHPPFFFPRVFYAGDLRFKDADSLLALVRATAARGPK